MCGVMCAAIDGRNNDADIGDLGGMAAIPANDAQDFRACSLRVLQSGYQIRADIFFQIAAADGEYKYKIVRAEATHP